ncbi:MAG: LysE family translocator [Pseudomonadota bacterium]
MPWESWTLYVATVLALMSAPGPSHLLMLSNSMAHGFRPSLATAVGDLSANLLQMLAAGLGLAALLAASQDALTVVKWAGAAYLAWMAVQMWRRAGRRADAESARAPRLRQLWLQGFLTSAANPKAVVFFAALFPQFIDPALPFGPQFAILSVTYLAIDGAFLTAYGAGASWAAARLTGAARRWIDRAGACCLLLAALLLGLKTLRESA